MARDDDKPFDDVLSERDEKVVEGLCATEVEVIDAAILAVADERWRKVAFIVSRLFGMNVDEPGALIIPIGFYVRRIAKLAERGQLESQGDLRLMGYSEVRLPRGRSRPAS